MFLKILGALFMICGGGGGVFVVTRLPADYLTTGLAVSGMIAIMWMGYDLYHLAAPSRDIPAE